MARRIGHSRKFELVSPSRVLSSGYLTLLFSCTCDVGGFRFAGESYYHYSYSDGCFVIRADVDENMVGRDATYYTDDPTYAKHDVVDFLNLHNIDHDVDSSNVINLTPGKNTYDNGYRGKGYNLIRIKCIEMSESEARAGFDADYRRWVVESADMERRDLAARERRKQRGIEKRKHTMELKREAKQAAVEKKQKKADLDAERKSMIKAGKTVGVLERGLKGIDDTLESIWGMNPEYSERRSLVMCDGVDFYRITSIPRVMPYGKHKGMLFDSIAGNYCAWLLGSMVDSIMNKGTAPTDIYYQLVDYFAGKV